MYALGTGVELELWVVDNAGRLCDGTAITAAHERIEPEFIDPLIELQTNAHTDQGELRRDLQSTLLTAIQAAEAEGKHLVPLGTPLTASEAEANCERGRAFETIYGSGIQSAKNCAGTHIHFEKDNVVDQLNLLTALDPALALVSSSPYYAGESVATSSRALAYRTECGSDFQCYTELWEYTDSLAEWRERVDERFDRFKRLAAERGVTPETVERLFTPENTVLNPVRLRECQPTVEWRAPDAALPSQIIRLANDVGNLVSHTRTATVEYGSLDVRPDRIRLPKFSTLEDLSRQAIGAGLKAPRVRSYLWELGFDILEYEPYSSCLKGSPRLSDAQARTRRLQQARRLRADVESLTRNVPQTANSSPVT